MKHQTAYRLPERVKILSEKIHHITTQPWKIMEICGGQTHAIAKYGLSDLLPSQIELIHGPGCPVCVTPKRILDVAMLIAAQPDVLFCSFGDMLRVPGSNQDLLSIKALGGDVRMIYSPLEAVELAQRHPEKQVVLFAVGFETTAPAHAMAIKQAAMLGLNNFSSLVSLVLVPPAMAFILGSPNNQVQGFLAAGHVCTVMGTQLYQPIAARYHVPVIITGFEPVDILQGVYHCVHQLEQDQAYVDNQYVRSVQAKGNHHAQALMAEIFEVADVPWRGIGTIAQSGLKIQAAYGQFDALNRFDMTTIQPPKEDTRCISGQILQGIRKPHHCTAFGKACTPETPLGAPMVSTEGACAAYYRYQKVEA